MLVMWCFNYMAGKTALRYMDGLTLATFRIELGTLIILPIYFLGRGHKRLKAADLWTFAYLGFLLVAVNQFCFTLGLSYTSSGHSSLVLAVGPILVLILACAIKQETFTTSKILGMAIAFSGAVILVTEQGLDIHHSATLAGDLITFTGSSAFSVYVVLGKKVAREYDSVSMNTFCLLVGAILLLPLAIRQGIRLDWRSIPWQGWAGVFYMAGISSVAAYILFYWALRHMDASRVAAVNYFQPIGVIILAAILLGERPTAHLLGGGALILLGVYLAERGSH
jgi:drug/metabolite transporter (DMT)-like permease